MTMAIKLARFTARDGAEAALVALRPAMKLPLAQGRRLAEFAAAPTSGLAELPDQVDIEYAAALPLLR